MKDYARIAMKIRETPWLITPEGLNVILGIVDARMKGESLTDEEIEIKLTEAQMRNKGRSESDGNGSVVNGVGILPIFGPIFGKANLMTEMSGATSLETFQSDFRAMMDNDMISSILLQIDSPGGTSEMVQEVGEEIFAARSEKPIYAIADTMSGSAAYWLMSQASSAYATPSGSVGSVGAYTVHEDRSAADAQQGRRFTFISAGEYKTEGNEHEPLSEEGRQYRQEVIDELYGDFVSAIATGRNVTTEQVKENYGGGRMLTAKKALDAGMIDGIMPFEQLVSTLVSQPRRVSLAIGDTAAKAFANANPTGMAGLTNLFGNLVGVVGNDGIMRLESKEWEHSEPGTGSPPTPRTDEDGSDDAAIKNKWRRDPLPLQQGDPGAPSPNANARKEEILNPEEYAQLCQLLGISVDSEFDTVATAIKAQTTELESLKQTSAVGSEEERLKKEFPQMWEEHQKMRTDTRNNDADKFVNSVRFMKQPTAVEGQLESTKIGLSSLAADTIKEMHVKFATGNGSLADFEAAISAITNGGTLEYGERGSAKVDELDLTATNIDTRSAEGIQNARTQFMTKIGEIQKQDNLEFEPAMKLAAERYPELAQAYRAAAVA